jgi:signal transduction histidine kinase
LKKTDRNPLLAGFFVTSQGHQTALEEASASLQGLPLSMPAPATLDQALSAIHDEFTPCRDAEFRILVNGQPKTLEPTIQEQVYLIVQEALLNALHHSGATNIDAEVEYLPHRLRLIVRDNGRGIDPQVQRSGASHTGGFLG